MKYFVSILKQFSEPMRLIVLVLLLTTTTVSYLVAEYLKTDDCKPIIEENLKMHEDFAKISAMLRAEQLRYNRSIVGSTGSSNQDTIVTRTRVTSLDTDTELQNAIMAIVESNKK